MMLKISFDFDESTQKVTNVKVTKSNSTITASTKSYDLVVEENKLVLTTEAINKLGAVAGDRISINYWTVDNETTYPIISKSEVFTDGANGNKVTQKGTISFKGQQRTSLLKFGSMFTFSEFKDKKGVIKDNVFVLTPVEDERETIKEDEFAEEKEAIENLNDSQIDQEIAEMLNESEDYDALPF